MTSAPAASADLGEATAHPIHFGPTERRLFGMLHAAEAGAPVRPGVVVCKPFGQEAIRTHRLLRVVAQRLARRGHHVLRFDPYGSGDSAGEDKDVDLEGWADDIRCADRELRARSGCEATVWFGLRLGGAAALRAARDSQAPPARVVVHEAVVHGRRYLRQLRRRHRTALAAAWSVRTPAAAGQRLHGELIGFELSSRLAEQVAALSIRSWAWPESAGEVTVIGDAAELDCASLLRKATRLAPGRVKHVKLRESVDWTTDTAESAALVPALMLAAILRGVSPDA